MSGKKLIQARGEKGALPLLLLGVFLFHLKPVFLGVSFQDPAAFHHDFQMGVPTIVGILRECKSSGRFPLWQSSQAMGSPFLGAYLPAAAHPLVWSLFSLSLETGVPLFLLINGELIALFGYLLFRRCGASPWGSAGAGFLLVFSGFIPWISLIYPIALMVPWLLCWLWSAISLSENPRARWWVLNTASVALILLSGDAQMVTEGAYFCAFWYLLRAFFLRTNPRRLARNLVIILAAAAAGLLISSCQLLPTLLFFSRVVSKRIPTLREYASTFMPGKEFALAMLGLFSREFRNLFLPFSAALLLAAGLRSARTSPELKASLALSGLIGVMLAGGRYGLCLIPFHLPLLKLFFRHYKWLVLLQGPLFLGVALGIDRLLESLYGRSRFWLVCSLVMLGLTLLVLPGHGWRAGLTGIALALGACILSARWRMLAPFVLFCFLVADAGSYAWQTLYKISTPEPDPVYSKYVRKAGCKSRVQIMYPWVVRAGEEVNQPLPVHVTGYYGGRGIDSWLEYPLREHAYFLAAVSTKAARINKGEFSKVDFSTPFKSTDFVSPENRHLVNLAALRYFFLQDFALSEADLIPILSDPAYLANPARPQAFAPFKRIKLERAQCMKLWEKCRGERPALKSEPPGVFRYQRVFREGDSLETAAVWDREAGLGGGEESGSWSWTVMGFESQGKESLLFARAVFPARGGAVEIAGDLGLGSSASGSLLFLMLPGKKGASGPGMLWIDPSLRNQEKTIRYLEGDRVMAFRNEEAFPRARVVHRGRLVLGNEQAFEVMKDKNRYDPKVETLLMSLDAEIIQGPRPGPDEKAEIVNCLEDEVALEVRLDSAGYVVLSDRYYPGWRAFSEDGEELRIFPADLGLRAVFLPPGTHRITFRYLPLQFRTGLYVSLAALLLGAALGLGRLAAYWR